MKNTKQLTLSAIFIALYIISGLFLNIKLPDPIPPMSMQIFFCLASGICLGKKYGAISVMVYIFMGLIGLPVFAKGGGIFYVLQPTFGYLIGFVLCAFIMGFAKKQAEKHSFWCVSLLGIIAVLAVYLIGCIYMYFILNFYLGKSMSVFAIFEVAVLPFIIKDFLLCFVLGAISKPLIKIINS
ncbi:MAG: biotin transporter BioY [Bacillota bacterium]|nr:biotin transporter BioY [Bacillota bacterium]